MPYTPPYKLYANNEYIRGYEDLGVARRAARRRSYFKLGVRFDIVFGGACLMHTYINGGLVY